MKIFSFRLRCFLRAHVLAIGALYLGTTLFAHEYRYTIQPITPEIQARMKYSWRDGNPVPLEHLRYVTVSHFGFDQLPHQGKLVVHQDVANDIVEIFKELFENYYPIEKMELIDEYEANDEASCADNNTSAFCSRRITGRTDRWSNHSYGAAIDINPRYNPFVGRGTVVPKNARPYLDRSILDLRLIKRGDVCYRAFTSRGWEWGGDWETVKDYQHFEKDGLSAFRSRRSLS